MVKGTVLITDDAQFMRALIKGILVPNKYAVIEASTGKEAIEQYQAHRPNLVLMDITMPGMDGIETTRAIKALDPGASIIVCSAMGLKNLVVEAIQAGAKDFIVKPFNPDKLLECVKKYCLSEAA